MFYDLVFVEMIWFVNIFLEYKFFLLIKYKIRYKEGRL